MILRKRRGFTLIELLVVIAIIAILAAILFPVFAQAKRAAKGAVAISDAKQLSLAQIMYTNDYDDAFSPIEFNSQWDAFTWSYLQQPYMKNWGIMLDPTGPVSLDTAQDLTIRGLWGMPPERISTNSQSVNDFTMGNTTQGQAFTGGRLYYFDGIGGVANGDVNGQFYISWGYHLGTTPSLTSTAVADPADQVMIAQAASWDFFWALAAPVPLCGGGGCNMFQTGYDTPDNFDQYFNSCQYNTYGCNATICAPIARKRDNDGASVGFFPENQNTSAGIAAAMAADAIQPLPSGLTVWAGVDGHVQSTPWRQLMGTTIPVTVGGKPGLAIKAFWPPGS